MRVMIEGSHQPTMPWTPAAPLAYRRLRACAIPRPRCLLHAYVVLGVPSIRVCRVVDTFSSAADSLGALLWSETEMHEINIRPNKIDLIVQVGRVSSLF